MDSAIWGLLIASGVLAVLWYRHQSNAGGGASRIPDRPTLSAAPASGTVPPSPVEPPALSLNEWTLTPAETVVRSAHRKR